MFHYHHALGILCNEGEIYIFEHGLYISALEHVRMLILRSYLLLGYINTVWKYCHTWMIKMVNISAFEHCRKVKVGINVHLTLIYTQILSDFVTCRKRYYNQSYDQIL